MVFSPNDPLPLQSSVTFPIFEYSRSFTGSHGACVIGGYIYRGSLSECHYGRYIFADQVNGPMIAENSTGVWKFRKAAYACSSTSPYPTCNQIFNINSFTEDNQGNVYLLGDNVKQTTIIEPFSF